MKTLNLFTKFSLIMGLLAIGINEVSATKVKKHRSHWGIWGGYGVVREVKTETDNGSTVHVYCEGDGDMKCKSDIAIAHENGRELTSAEINLIESLHDLADTNGGNGNNQGSTNNIITIAYPDGMIISYLYTLQWYQDVNGQYVSEVSITQYEIPAN